MIRAAAIALLGAALLGGPARATDREWVLSTDTSPIDDSKNVYAYRSATTSFTNLWKEGFRPRLWVVCVDHQTQFLVDMDGNKLGSAERRRYFISRLDGKTAQTHTDLVRTPDGRSYGMVGGRAVSFIRSIAGGKELLIRILALDELTVDARFELEGIKQAAQKVAEACDWKL